MLIKIIRQNELNLKINLNKHCIPYTLYDKLNEIIVFVMRVFYWSMAVKLLKNNVMACKTEKHITDILKYIKTQFGGHWVQFNCGIYKNTVARS